MYRFFGISNEKYVNATDSDIPKVALDQAQVSSLVGAVLGIAGVVAIIFIIIGGYKYVVSQGNPQEVQKAKETIIYALVGLVIVMMAFTIVQFVTRNLF